MISLLCLKQQKNTRPTSAAPTTLPAMPPIIPTLDLDFDCCRGDATGGYWQGADAEGADGDGEGGGDKGGSSPPDGTRATSTKLLLKFHVLMRCVSAPVSVKYVLELNPTYMNSSRISCNQTGVTEITASVGLSPRDKVPFLNRTSNVWLALS